MTRDVNRRAYRSTKRQAAAEATRQAILAAAHQLFIGQGYARTTVAEIADRASVNVDTIYATVGRKPELMRAVLEAAISGVAHAVPAAQRDYVRAIRAAPEAEDKLAIYASALAEMAPRTAPVFEALRLAGLTDPTCADLHAEITGRRAGNMRQLAAELRSTGRLRRDLTDDEVADIIWSMNSADYYLLLVRDRGWSTEQYGTHLADAWRRILLAD
ncbi:MAG TPA: helix-turn-helix domain-containing protein [Microlunatus sp.]|nr:helix-turn-helix domain-containing protein [Microlunatus sp.]